MDKTFQIKVSKYDGKHSKVVDELAICEYPLNIFVNGRHLTVLLCTPEKLEELTVGFLIFHIVISKSAPTDLSIKFAEALNVTLVGFVRERRMNVYTNPQRII